jgi:hypothetical protein
MFAPPGQAMGLMAPPATYKSQGFAPVNQDSKGLTDRMFKADSTTRMSIPTKRIVVATDDGFKLYQIPRDNHLLPTSSEVYKSSMIDTELLKLSEVRKPGFKFKIRQKWENKHMIKFSDADVVIAISHCWITDEDPDPDGVQAAEFCKWIKNRDFANGDSTIEVGIFYDYSCLPQENSEYKRDANEKKIFDMALDAMGQLYLLSNEVYIMNNNANHDYNSRSWCVFESTLASLAGNVQSSTSFKFPAQDYDLTKQSDREVDKIVERLFEKTKQRVEKDRKKIKDMLKTVILRNQTESGNDLKKEERSLKEPLSHYSILTIKKDGHVLSFTDEVEGCVTRPLIAQDKEKIRLALQSFHPCCNYQAACIGKIALIPVGCFFCCNFLLCNKMVNRCSESDYEHFRDFVPAGFKYYYIQDANNLCILFTKVMNHKITFTIHPKNIEEDGTHLIKLNYNSIKDMVKKANSGYVIPEVAQMLLPMNAIDFTVIDELHPDG